MPISVHCEACQTRFRAGDEHAGKRGKCPRCGSPITVPAASPSAPVAQARPAAQPAISQPRPTAPQPRPAVPQPRPVAPQAASKAPVNNSLMADLLDEAAAEPLPPTRCQSCGQMLPAGTVVCISCGYNIRTGQCMQTVIERPKEEPEAKTAENIKAVAGFAGSFILGVVASVFATAFGMAIWLVVAVVTGLEIGWIAWGVGALAGLGMRLGYRREDDLAGITAAFIALLGIVGTKFAIFRLAMAAGFFDLEMENGASASGLFFTEMLGVLGIFFLLLAFFTAYKFGRGSS